ncbi:MAG: transcription elongation factor GreB [Myxococcales bacterium]|nr:transcription elongation factor GreB [Myxococcales bacterium]
MVRFLTFNIRLGLDSSVEAIAEWLGSWEADVIALQEVGQGWVMGDGGDQSARVAERLGMHHAYVPALFERNAEARYGIALLSRERIATKRRIELFCRDDEQRVLLIAEIAAPTPFWVLTTHLSIRDADRAEQLRTVAESMQPHLRPYVLLGDLNTTPERDELAELLRRTGAHDCHGDGAPSYPTRAPAQRLDHIIASPDWRVDEPARPVADVVLSDHLPVAAELTLESSERARIAPGADAESSETPSLGRNYITPSGFRALQTERQTLVGKTRPEVTAVVAWAAGNGDRSENADYHYGKRRLREIDRRIRFLDQRLDSAIVVDPAQQRGTSVYFGASVTLRDEDDELKSYAIVGVDEIDLARNRISWVSPLARALLKREVGDVVIVETPAGERELEIVEVVYRALD